MHTRLLSTLRLLCAPHPATLIALAAVCLTMIGLVVLSSAGRGFGGDAYFILKRQTIWTLVALVAFIATLAIDLDMVRRRIHWIGFGSLALLILVLIPGIGVEVNGARRWLDLGLMRLQVSDFAKLGLLLCLAHYLSVRQRELSHFVKGYGIPMVMIGVTAALVMLQPDFGTALLIGMAGFLMVFVAGVSLWYLIPTVLAGLSLFSVAVYLNPVRLARITAFMDIEGNKSDGAYQLWQGILAFGAGGINGVGLGNGRQQLSFLPEAHTDFIFPIIGEELGLVTTVSVVLLFIAFFAAAVIHLRKAPALFDFLVVFGALMFLLLQALINMGVATGLLPTKGMSLPFISYGGTNLLVMFILVGLIINCFCRWDEPVLRKRRDL